MRNCETANYVKEQQTENVKDGMPENCTTPPTTASNACDTGNLVISGQTSIGLSKWCVSWAVCSAVATVHEKVIKITLLFDLRSGLKPNCSSAKG